MSYYWTQAPVEHSQCAHSETGREGASEREREGGRRRNIREAGALGAKVRSEKAHERKECGCGSSWNTKAFSSPSLHLILALIWAAGGLCRFSAGLPGCPLTWWSLLRCGQTCTRARWGWRCASGASRKGEIWEVSWKECVLLGFRYIQEAFACTFWLFVIHLPLICTLPLS